MQMFGVYPSVYIPRLQKPHISGVQGVNMVSTVPL